MADSTLTISQAAKRLKKKQVKEDASSTIMGLANRMKSPRKQDKFAQKDKSAGGLDVLEADSTGTPDLYECSGRFETDYTEMCGSLNIIYIPPIVPRPKRPSQPINAKGGRDKNKQTGQLDQEADAGDEVDGEGSEPPPKTYTVKGKSEYFTPSIQVQMDNPDKQDSVREVYIRGWKIDVPMMNVFKQCWPAMEKLQTINLWQAGLTGETVEILATCLPNCKNIRNLILDGNWIKEENWYMLIDDDNSIQTMSLKHCKITDIGAKGIGGALGTAKRFNTKLLSLSLAGNNITDEGVEHLAKGLRMNRALLSLSLANNQVRDRGAKALAEILSRISLTHEEIVERRKLLSEKEATDMYRLQPHHSRRDRPGSVRSAYSDKSKRDKSSAKKAKDGKSKEEEKKVGQKKESQDKNPQKKGNRRGSRGSTLEKSIGKKSFKSAMKRLTPVDFDTIDSHDVISPLLEDLSPEYDDDEETLKVFGNRVLVNLNLSRNKITEVGIKELTSAISKQNDRRNSNASSVTQLSFSDSRFSGPGLMILCVHHNDVSPKSEELRKLNDLMAPKHPFYQPSETPETDIS